MIIYLKYPSVPSLISLACLIGSSLGMTEGVCGIEKTEWAISMLVLSGGIVRFFGLEGDAWWRQWGNCGVYVRIMGQKIIDQTSI